MAPWQPTLSTAITALVALLALAGVGVTVRQRFVADRNDQLWKRMEWAMSLLLSESNDARMIGFLAIATLLSDHDRGRRSQFRIGPVDLEFLRTTSDTVITRLLHRGGDDEG